MNIRTYDELIKIKDFRGRFEYLKLGGKVGETTFGWERYLNQQFYKSPEWKKVRDEVIVRDLGCDLGIVGRDILTRIYIHHMNPISPKDIVNRTDILLNPNYLICTSKSTHEAIHYGDESLLLLEPVIRTPNDTCPWK